jgi:predicted RNase H-like HicB family nuclease
MEQEIFNFTVLIEQDEDGIYIAKVPDITGCYTQGKSVEQVMERIKEAIQVCIEAEDRDNILPLKFVGVQQLEVKLTGQFVLCHPHLQSACHQLQ